MNDIFDDVKRVKIFDKLVFGIGKRKFIVKDLEKPNMHQTMAFRKNGIVDVHITKEGSKKEYESIGKFDVMKTAIEMILNPKILERAFMGFIDGLKEVNFEESEFAHLSAAPFPTKEEFALISKKKQKDLVIPIESLEKFNLLKIAIPWNEAKGKIKDNALVYDKDVPAGCIFKKGEKFLFMSANIAKKPDIFEFLYKATHPDKISDKK